MLQWENKEEEPEVPLRDHQVEEDHQEEEDPRLQEEQRRNRSQQQQTSKPWAKTPSLQRRKKQSRHLHERSREILNAQLRCRRLQLPKEKGRPRLDIYAGTQGRRMDPRNAPMDSTDP